MNKNVVKGIIVACVFFASAGATFAVGSVVKGNSNKSDTVVQTTAAALKQTSPKYETTAVPSTAELTDAVMTTAVPETTVEQPQGLSDCLEKGNISYEYLDEISCSQLITVESDSSNANISMFEKDANGKWTNSGVDTPGFVGERGVSFQSQEGSLETPGGLYSIGEAFYIDSKPQTGLNTFEITNDTYWVDDPKSQHYNMRVEGTSEMDWNSAEHMVEYYSSYCYGFVIDFNVNPIVKGKGSAIFFHCGNSPTLGCVSTSQEMVLKYLSKLEKSKSPYILIL